MNMDVRRKHRTTNTFMFIFLFLLVALSSCSSRNTELPTPSPIFFIPSETIILILPMPDTPTPNCVNGLTFISDITINDNSSVPPGSVLDKQWLVQNSGTCNWDDRYRIRLISGDPLGASTEQATYPARARTQATFQIIFTAPLDAGSYTSEWQVFDNNGVPFGDTFFIKIVVQP
jgi:hypothetical protein